MDFVEITFLISYLAMTGLIFNDVVQIFKIYDKKKTGEKQIKAVYFFLFFAGFLVAFFTGFVIMIYKHDVYIYRYLFRLCAGLFLPLKMAFLITQIVQTAVKTLDPRERYNPYD